MKPYLIGIAGRSGAGKSYLAAALAAHLEAALISLDSYYRHQPDLSYEQRCRMNFDHPEALDHALLCRQLRALAQGAPVDTPTYDFTTHLRRTVIEPVEPRDYIVVEGLFTLFWPEVRNLFPTKIFVDLEDPVCYRRRLDRDVRERGRTAESVRRQYDETVRPMAEQYIVPSLSSADLIIRGDADLAMSLTVVLDHIRKHGGS